MHDKEIQYFVEGLNLAKNEFYLDAINKFDMLIDEYSQSDLADDALYNVGLCYFKINQFEQAIETFNQVITNYPDATISALDNGNEFGLTAAKCYYGILLLNLSLGNINKIESTIEELKKYNENTYVIVDNEKKSYEDLSKELLIKFREK
ncbi:MAG: tetratricopeptide (TPR) repeat protein [bacterium]|jgi:tetratricopeptide (TPR) repeat protein